MDQISNPGILGNIWRDVEKVEIRLNWLLFWLKRYDYVWFSQAGEAGT